MVVPRGELTVPAEGGFAGAVLSCERNTVAVVDDETDVSEQGTGAEFYA